MTSFLEQFIGRQVICISKKPKSAIITLSKSEMKHFMMIILIIPDNNNIQLLEESIYVYVMASEKTELSTKKS